MNEIKKKADITWNNKFESESNKINFTLLNPTKKKIQVIILHVKRALNICEITIALITLALLLMARLSRLR